MDNFESKSWQTSQSNSNDPLMTPSNINNCNKKIKDCYWAKTTDFKEKL